MMSEKIRSHSSLIESEYMKEKNNYLGRSGVTIKTISFVRTRFITRNKLKKEEKNMIWNRLKNFSGGQKRTPRQSRFLHPHRGHRDINDAFLLFLISPVPPFGGVIFEPRAGQNANEQPSILAWFPIKQRRIFFLFKVSNRLLLCPYSARHTLLRCGYDITYLLHFFEKGFR